MVVPTRELVNTLIPITIKATILDPMVLNNYNMDMDIDTVRGRSVSSSTNSLRAFSVCSNTSSIPYHERMEIQSSNLPWSEQVEIDKRESFSLSYATSKAGDRMPANKATDNSSKDGVQCANKKAPALNNMPTSQGENKVNNNTNTCSSQGFTNIPISYEIDKPVEPNAWNGKAHSISIFGTMEFLEIDSINITTSLLCMANFIKNRSIDCKLANSIIQLKSFG